MTALSSPQFKGWRAILWPIYRHEVRRLFPMMLISFLICFNYSILRSLKDAIVVTSSGAEVIPFIKVWVILPAAVGMTYFFTRLSSSFSQERVFYIMMSTFLLFYLLFAFLLYPWADSLHLDRLANYLETVLPLGCKGLIEMCRRWSFIAFYVMSELWGSMVMVVLFWGFANRITRLSEARRFYGLLGVVANVAAILSGQLANFLIQPNGTLQGEVSDAWGASMRMLIILIAVSGCLAMIIFRWMHRTVLMEENLQPLHLVDAKAKKPRLSLRESFVYLSQSKYLLCIAVIVVCYNVILNLSEVIWKDQLGHLYTNAFDYNVYMNNLTSIIGVLSTLVALFMPYIIGRLGWTFAALTTPVVMLITSIGFFSFYFFREAFNDVLLASLGVASLNIAVFFGSAQNVLSRAAKYSVFDGTKEMAFVPLSDESKLKGKAAIDGIGSLFGKSGGAIVYQGLLIVVSNLTASTPYVATVMMVILGLWIVAAISLGKQFNLLAHSSKAKEAVPLTTTSQAA